MPQMAYRRCIHCSSPVEKAKHVCSRCHNPICKQCRGKVPSGAFSNDYFCIRGCPTTSYFPQQPQPVVQPQYPSSAYGAAAQPHATQVQRQQPPVAVVQPHQKSSQQQPQPQPNGGGLVSSSVWTHQDMGGDAPDARTHVHRQAPAVAPQQQPQQQAQHPRTNTVSPRPVATSEFDSLFSGIQERQAARNQLGTSNDGMGTSQGTASFSSPDARLPTPSTPPVANSGRGTPSSSVPLSSQLAAPSPSQSPSSPATSGSGHIPYPTLPPANAAGLREIQIEGGDTALVIGTSKGVQPTGDPFLDDRSNQQVIPYVDKLIEVNGRRGVVMGVRGGQLVWQERGTRKAQLIDPRTQFTQLKGCKCKHCGALLPQDEATEHVAMHKKGAETSVNGDIGTCCGNTNLIRKLVRVHPLGEGAQGQVWLCHDMNKNSFVSKDIVCDDDADARRQYQKSVRLMALNHPHLIEYNAVQLHPNRPMVTVIMKFYEEGDLSALIRKSGSRLEETFVCSLVLQICAALNFMHSREPPIIHGDIKPENLLMFSGGQQVILMDLDTSKELIGVRRETKVHQGTTAWMAPEAINDGVESPGSDIWSVGLVMYVLLVLPDYPMIDNELLNSTSWASGGSSAKLEDRVISEVGGRNYSRELTTLVARMLSHDRKRRPTATELEASITEIMTNQLMGGGSF